MKVKTQLKAGQTVTTNVSQTNTSEVNVTQSNSNG
jgi:hypothetical protein